MELLPALFLLCLLAVGIGLSMHFAPGFVIRIVEGEPRVKRGTVTGAFLAELRDACQRHGLRAGTVRGLHRGPRVMLSFSHHFPPACCQQLRNWWAMSGWAAKPARH